MAQTVWDISQLERRLPDGDLCPDGAVYTAHWIVSLEENGESVSAYGSVNFGDPNPEAFIPFSQLTKPEILNWVFEVLGPTQITSIEEALNNQLQQKLNPTTEVGVPW